MKITTIGIDLAKRNHGVSSLLYSFHRPISGHGGFAPSGESRTTRVAKGGERGRYPYSSFSGDSKKQKVASQMAISTAIIGHNGQWPY